jgi:hypothetical protein
MQWVCQRRIPPDLLIVVILLKAQLRKKQLLGRKA